MKQERKCRGMISMEAKMLSEQTPLKL